MNEIKANQVKPNQTPKISSFTAMDGEPPIGGRLVTLEPIVQLTADAPLSAAR
jgi:hypothetical protein